MNTCHGILAPRIEVYVVPISRAEKGLTIVGSYQVVIAGVSEEALKKRLPQLAWGLSRQGGPSAAQLARITMLRVRPALLLEQLLQPQSLSARNAKVRKFVCCLV